MLIVLILVPVEVAQGFLKREWLGAEGEREKGAKHNEHLQALLKYV